MNFKRNVMAAGLAVGLAWNLAAAEPDAAKLKAELETLWTLAKSQPGDRDARIAKNSSIMESCEKLLKEYADLPRTNEQRDILSRVVMLDAAERLYRDAPTVENRKILLSVAEDVISLPVHDSSLWGERRKPVAPNKARAGKLLAMTRIYETPGAAPKEAAKHIQAMLALFPDNPDIKGSEATRKQALVYALQLASDTGEKELVQELGRVVEEKCLDTQDALNTLMAAGCPVAFTGELTTLDGGKLTFPKDTQGKIVVVDFWATWCGPCVASLPHMKNLHEKYKDRGVWVIGVSCDTPNAGETVEQNKKKVMELVAAKGCDWTQTYSGQWPAIASKYGVGKLPTVFLLDPQGRILSTSARGQEEKLIEQALAAPPMDKEGAAP